MARVLFKDGGGGGVGSGVGAGPAFVVTESPTYSDLMTVSTLAETAQSRSGTPDSDVWGDGFTEQAAGNQGVNHGNENPLQASGLAALNLRAYIKIDLRRFTNLTASGNSHPFTFKCSNQAAVGTNLDFACVGQTGDPFTESTLTWTNQPAIPTQTTRSFTDITASTGTGGTALTRTVTFTNAEMNLLLGKWVLICFTSPDTAGGTKFISSREAAAPQRMTLTFTAQRQ